MKRIAFLLLLAASSSPAAAAQDKFAAPPGPPPKADPRTCAMDSAMARLVARYRDEKERREDVIRASERTAAAIDPGNLEATRTAWRHLVGLAFDNPAWTREYFAGIVAGWCGAAGRSYDR